MVPDVRRPSWMGALLFDFSAVERSLLTMLRRPPLPKASVSKPLNTSQFGIRHILLGTILLSLLLGLLRACDLLSPDRWLSLGGPWLGFASSLLLLGVLVAVALWVATSDGCTCLQAGLLLVAVGTLATALLLLDALFGQPLTWLR